MVLVDTSVWIAAFRPDIPFALEDEVEFDEIVVAPPVVQEILQGLDAEPDYRLAKEALRALPCIDAPMPRARYEEAATLYRLARRTGRTIRSGVDCLIAASALRAALTVLHVDRDFEALAQVAPLDVRRVELTTAS